MPYRPKMSSRRVGSGVLHSHSNCGVLFAWRSFSIFMKRPIVFLATLCHSWINKNNYGIAYHFRWLVFLNFLAASPRTAVAVETVELLHHSFYGCCYLTRGLGPSQWKKSYKKGMDLRKTLGSMDAKHRQWFICITLGPPVHFATRAAGVFS